MTLRNNNLTNKIIIGLLTANIALTGAAIYQRDTEIKEIKQQADINSEAIGTVSEQLDSIQQQVIETQQQIDELKETHESTQQKVEDIRRGVSRGSSRGMEVIVTAYDLSEASCSKGPSHPAYGLTATGKSLAGHTLESARAIAVDPNVIPLGSKVRIKFSDPDMQQYNGIYTACDTGGAIRGNRIDLFAGEGAHSLAMSIGRRHAVAVVL